MSELEQNGVQTAPEPAKEVEQEPTREEFLSSELDKVKEKWNSLASDDEQVVIPADEPTGEAADAGAVESAAEDAVSDLPERQELAARYGLGVEQLERFSTVKDAKEALTLWDERQLFGGELPRESERKAEPKREEEPPKEQDSLGLDLSGLDEDDPARKSFSILEKEVLAAKREAAEARQLLEHYQGREVDRDRHERGQLFQSHLDALNSERYGSIAKATPQQIRNREYLQQKINEVADRLWSEGREAQIPRDVRAFADRLDAILFKDQIETEKQARQKEAKESAPTRRQLGRPGTGQPRAMSPSKKLGDFNGEPKDDPAMQELWSELEGRGY